MKRFIVAVLAVAVLVIAGAVIIGQLSTGSLEQIANRPNVTPPTTNFVAGFGSKATKDLYAKVEQFFSTLKCEQLLSEDAIKNNLGGQNTSKFPKAIVDPILKGDINVTSLTTVAKNPKNCRYDLPGGKQILLSMYTYDVNSKIDNGPLELYSRVNQLNMSSIIYQANGSATVTFFGPSKTSGKCVSHIFHAQNDFEYIKLEYSGYICAEIKEVDNMLSEIVGDYIFAYMNQVSRTQGYGKLCGGWARTQTEYCDPTLNCKAVICDASGNWLDNPGGVSACRQSCKIRK